MDKTTRVASFKALCGSEVISWLSGQDFAFWDKLKKSFKSNWCEKLEPEEALGKLYKVKQKELDHIQVYISQF